MAYDPADPAGRAVQIQIEILERSQHRAVREHLLGDPTAMGRIQQINSQITVLRTQLPQGVQS